MEDMELKLFNNIYKNKKILITGHTGFKGSWLALWLSKLGAEVIGFSLENKYENPHIKLLNLDIKEYIEDIRDYTKISSAINEIQPDFIFHLAAQPLVRYSYENPIETYSTNVIGTANILNSLRFCNNTKGILVVTTDKCYKNIEKMYAYKESDELGGYDPYSSSKACTEIVCQSFRDSFFNIKDYNKNHNLLIASARAGNVIGGGDWSEDRLIPDIIKATINDCATEIRNPKATRPWQHVLESLSGYLSLGEKLILGKKEFSGAYNFGPQTNKAYTVEEVSNIAKSHWNKIKFSYPPQKGQPHEANLLQIDSSKAISTLNWNQVWNESESIKQTIIWYKEFINEERIISYDQIKKYINDASNLGIKWTK